MRLLDFIEKTNLQNKAESERATFLCFYHYMESQVQHFTMQDISEMMISSGFNSPNTSRLKEKLLKGRDKAFTKSKDNASAIVFIPAILQKFEDDLGALWSDNNYFTKDELVKYYDEARRTKPANISVSLNRLAQKGLIMDATDVEPKMPKPYRVSSEGIEYIKAYVPKEDKEKKTTKAHKPHTKSKSSYTTLEGNGKEVKRKLLNKGIEYAESLTVDTQ